MIATEKRTVWSPGHKIFILTSFICLFSFGFVEFASGKGCDLDVMFILDSSSSVRATFAKQVDFVLDLADLLTIGPGAQRAAILEYSGPSKIVKTFGFDFFESTAEFKDTVASLRLFSGITSTRRALEHAKTVLESRRSEFETLVIIVTDGYANDQPEIFAPEIRKMENIHVFAVGLDDPVNFKALVGLTGDPLRVFTEPGALLNARALLESYVPCDRIPFRRVVGPNQFPDVELNRDPDGDRDGDGALDSFPGGQRRIPQAPAGPEVDLLDSGETDDGANNDRNQRRGANPSGRRSGTGRSNGRNRGSPGNDSRRPSSSSSRNNNNNNNGRPTFQLPLKLRPSPTVVKNEDGKPDQRQRRVSTTNEEPDRRPSNRNGRPSTGNGRNPPRNIDSQRIVNGPSSGDDDDKRTPSLPVRPSSNNNNNNNPSNNRNRNNRNNGRSNRNNNNNNRRESSNRNRGGRRPSNGNDNNSRRGSNRRPNNIRQTSEGDRRRPTNNSTIRRREPERPTTSNQFNRDRKPNSRPRKPDNNGSNSRRRPNQGNRRNRNNGGRNKNDGGNDNNGLTNRRRENNSGRTNTKKTTDNFGDDCHLDLTILMDTSATIPLAFFQAQDMAKSIVMDLAVHSDNSKVSLINYGVRNSGPIIRQSDDENVSKRDMLDEIVNLDYRPSSSKACFSDGLKYKTQPSSPNTVMIVITNGEWCEPNGVINELRRDGYQLYFLRTNDLGQGFRPTNFDLKEYGISDSTVFDSCSFDSLLDRLSSRYYCNLDEQELAAALLRSRN